MLSAILRDAAVKAMDADLDIRVTPLGFSIEGRRLAAGKVLGYRKVLTFEEGIEAPCVWDAAIAHTSEALRHAETVS